MAESSFWRSLRKKIPGHVMRVENSCMPGTPDLNVCQDGRDFWVELKDVDKFPARPTTRVFGDEGLRPEQVLWIIQRTRAGGEVYIVGKVDNEIFCLHGREAENFNRYTRSELEARNLDYKVVLGVVSKPK